MKVLILILFSFLIFNFNTIFLLNIKNFRSLLAQNFPTQLGFFIFLFFGINFIEHPYYFDTTSKASDAMLLLCIIFSTLFLQILLWIKNKRNLPLFLNLSLFLASWVAFLGIFSPFIFLTVFCIFSLLKLVFSFSIYQVGILLICAICLYLSIIDFSTLYFFSYLPYICPFLNLALLGFNIKNRDKK